MSKVRNSLQDMVLKFHTILKQLVLQTISPVPEILHRIESKIDQRRDLRTAEAALALMQIRSIWKRTFILYQVALEVTRVPGQIGQVVWEVGIWLDGPVAVMVDRILIGPDEVSL